MTLLALLDRLKRQRVRLRHPRASTGFGERRSRRKGAGLEHAESRPYRQGDDLRYIDPRLSVRTGERYVREFHLEQRAAVQIVLDGGASMAWKGEAKFELAKAMAKIFGFIGLVSGDQVQIVSTVNGRLQTSPWFQGERRSPQLFEHLDRCPLDPATDLVQRMAQARPILRPKAVVIVISDFLAADALALLGEITAAGRDLIAVQTIHALEAEPAFRPGAYTLSDRADTAIDLWLDAEALSLYREEFAAWRSQLKRFVEQQPSGIFITAHAPFDQAWDVLGDLVQSQLTRRVMA